MRNSASGRKSKAREESFWKMKISNYLKSKIKGKSWKDKKYVDYIEELMNLETCIRYGAGGWTANMMFNNLKAKYKKEYLTIMKELFPKRLDEEKKRDLKEKKEDEMLEKELAKEEREEEQQEKELWLELGGVE